LAGCNSLGKKDGAAPTPPAAAPGGAPPAKFPTGGGDPILNSTSASTPGQAVIAGRVLDEYDPPAAHSLIQLGPVTQKEPRKRVDIAATPDGYFTIQGLKPGVDYKLIARTKTGERLIAGQTQTSAPNIRVVIKMRKDLVTAGIPDIPGHIGD